MDAVGDLLAERQADRVPWGPATLLAFLLHAGILAGMLVSAFAHPMHFAPPRYVAIRMIPAGSLRAPEAVRAAPAPPAATERPKIEKPVEEPPPPSQKAVLLPAKERKKPTPPPVSRPGRSTAPSVSLPSAGEEISGASAGQSSGAGGKAGIGSMKFDQPDFNYPVYIERMALIIGLNWFKPAQFQTSPVVHFIIERDGTITDPRLVTSSGLPFVDRAALRAVIASSPLPPLPAEFPGPRQGVQIVFE